MGACASSPSVDDVHAQQPAQFNTPNEVHAHNKAAVASGGHPLGGHGARKSVASSEGRTSDSCYRTSDELMALPADKHANHCHDSASSHPGHLAFALSSLTSSTSTPKSMSRQGSRGTPSGQPPARSATSWPAGAPAGAGLRGSSPERQGSLQNASSPSRRASQDIPPVSEGIVFQPDMPMSPFQRDIGTHQMRQRLSLDATSLVRQGSLEFMTFERKQQANRRYSMSVDALHAPAAGRQATGVVKDVQKSAQAGIERILGLCKSIFRVDSVLLHLCDGNTVFARPGDTTFDEELRRTACNKLAPPDEKAAACEDLDADARLEDAPEVRAALQYFAGSPLVAPNGYRLGSMCLLHGQPMKLSLANMAILKNMSDLMTRELWGAYQDSYKQRILQLKKVTDCYSEPHMFVEVSDLQPWVILSLNAGALKTTGLEGQDVVDQKLWDIFDRLSSNNGQKSRTWAERASKGFSFALTNMKRKSQDSSEPVTFSLNFRPAARELITQGNGEMKPRPVSNAGRHCYFVGIRVEATAPITSAVERTPFVGLQLGQMLGKGAYGRVYKGYYRGNLIAVKVCSSGNLRCTQEGVPIEAFLKDHLQHPQLVRLLDSATAQRSAVARFGRRESMDVQAGMTPPRNGSAAFPQLSDGFADMQVSTELETWLLLEYCDMGTLMDAVSKEWFRSCPKGPANSATVLAVALEIAAGMSYLHDRGIVHGDLSSGNILLASTSTMPHGFSAKVSDFGLAREMDIQSKIATNTTGTVTYMPPETIADGMVSKAADVYAFGVLLWEMLSGERAWANLTAPQVMVAVTCQNKTLEFPSCTMHDIARLGRQCMSKDPKERPTFEEVSRSLKHTTSKLMRADSSDLSNFRSLSCP